MISIGLYFEDHMYAAYMGTIPHDLSNLQSLVTSDKTLQSSLNLILSRKSVRNYNQFLSPKLDPSKYILKDSRLKVSITQPSADRPLVSDNIIRYSIEGVSLFPKGVFKSVDSLSIEVSLDGTALSPLLVDREDYELVRDSLVSYAQCGTSKQTPFFIRPTTITHILNHTFNQILVSQEYQLQLHNLSSGAHTVEVTATAAMTTPTAGSKGTCICTALFHVATGVNSDILFTIIGDNITASSSNSKIYLSSTRLLFYYLDTGRGNTVLPPRNKADRAAHTANTDSSGGSGSGGSSNSATSSGRSRQSTARAKATDSTGTTSIPVRDTISLKVPRSFIGQGGFERIYVAESAAAENSLKVVLLNSNAQGGFTTGHLSSDLTPTAATVVDDGSIRMAGKWVLNQFVCRQIVIVLFDV